MADIVGNIGVIFFLLAYFLLQKGSISHMQGSYLLLNFSGSLMLIFSLLVNWNLSAFLLETAWALISMWGIIKYVYLPWLKKRKQNG